MKRKLYLKSIYQVRFEVTKMVNIDPMDVDGKKMKLFPGDIINLKDYDALRNLNFQSLYQNPYEMDIIITN